MSEGHTILVVDDFEALREGIQLELEEAGYRTIAARDGEEALEQLHEEDIDLIIADVAMPRLNGYQLFERTSENPDWVYIPFIFLTGRDMDSDVRYGKSLGADDYLTKPFDPDDLLAAVRGKLRRAQRLIESAAHAGAPAASQTLVVGSLEIEPSSRRVRWQSEPVDLSAREFALLEHLARHAEKVVSVQDLVQTTHDLHTGREEASTLIRPLIRSVRRKLGAKVGETGCIETVRGVGYRLTSGPP